MNTSVAEVLIRFFRDAKTMKYRRGCNIKCLSFEYADREREAILSLMSGVLHDNPYLEEF